MSVRLAVRDWLRDGWAGWCHFWFTPQDPATLGLIRMLTGGMLFYTHLVWGLDFEAFFGPDSWVSYETALRLQGSPFVWSHFWWIRSLPLLWVIHALALSIFALLAIGLFSRAAAVLACLTTLSYMHRVPGALFGLDQINAVLSMYVAVGPCGDAYSLDRWLARRGEIVAEGPRPSVAANVAIRLLQLHMCVIYAFAGMAKLQGITWWNGTAMWGAIANLEYQSIDMTWLVHYPLLISAMTHLTVYWEIYYCALIWPRWTRPIALFLAVPLHLGIALFLGMITFGLAMLIGNLAFVPAGMVRRVLGGAPRERADSETTIRSITAPHARTTRPEKRLGTAVVS